MTRAGAPPADAAGGSWPLFAAVRVPRRVAQVLLTLARASHDGRDPVRWVDPADVHVTLWFIGRVEVEALPGLRIRLAQVAAGARPFTARIDGAGTFGSGRRRATWIGMAEPGAGRLQALAHDLRADPFTPHITVVRGAPAALATVLSGRLVEHRLATGSLAWRTTRLELLRTRPGARPAYQTVAAFRLGRRAAT
ncbi:MAG: RNA 2',3'-cyclic phosphodiesterase [Candidatus Limnocylindrales bacterium]